jgi:hypothetical protein
MHKETGTYWKPNQELASYLQQEPRRLNPLAKQDTFACLSSLRKEAIGGILLVAQHYAKGGTTLAPYITVIAAPSLATLGQFSSVDPRGITFSNFWDDSVLSNFAYPAPSGLRCPILAATKGFLPIIKLPGAIGLLTSSQPMFFPCGEQLAKQIPLQGGGMYRALFLPKVCGLPLGMVWPTTTKFDEMYSSILALCSGYSHFL